MKDIPAAEPEVTLRELTVLLWVYNVRMAAWVLQGIIKEKIVKKMFND
jgi:hypothetical protein